MDSQAVDDNNNKYHNNKNKLTGTNKNKTLLREVIEISGYIIRRFWGEFHPTHFLLKPSKWLSTLQI